MTDWNNAASNLVIGILISVWINEAIKSWNPNDYGGIISITFILMILGSLFVFYNINKEKLR